MRGYQVVYILILFLALSGIIGCENRPVGDTKDAHSSVAPGTEDESPQQDFVSKKRIELSLVPEVPTTNTDIRALLHGSASVEGWRWEVNGESIAEVDGTLLPKEFFEKNDLVAVTVTGNGVESGASVRVGNSPPRILSVPFVNAEIHRGVDIRVEPEAIDDDGDAIDFRCEWMLNGETLSWVDGPLLAGDQFQKGDRVKLTVFPFDGEDEGSPFKGLELEIPNAPPSFISLPPESFKAVEYRYQARAEDPDDEEVIYALAEGPDNMTIDSATGLVVWPVPDGVEGEFLVRIEAHDSDGMSTYQEYTLSLSKGG